MKASRRAQAPAQTRGPNATSTAAPRETGVAVRRHVRPRRCGIATFTGDLAAAVAGTGEARPPDGARRHRTGGQYQYPAEVKFEIRQNVKADYARAAEFVNYSHVRLVSIQHEYGIFGGDDGGYILDFVQALRVPPSSRCTRCSSSPSGIKRRSCRRCADGARSSS